MHEVDLFSQSRCNGSDGYLDWLDDALGIRPAPERIVDLDYDFRVFDDPNELFAAIAEKNAANNKSRVVAGYCWEWPKESKGNPRSHDIVLPEHAFAKSWNLDSTGTWAIDDGSIDQVGCVHTSQGLEFDYVGVIVGDDLRIENGVVVTDHTKRAKSDKSLSGIKSLAKSDPERAQRIADEVIRNTYRVLMTRGTQGVLGVVRGSCAGRVPARADAEKGSGVAYAGALRAPPYAAADPPGVASVTATRFERSARSVGESRPRSNPV